MSVQRRFFKLRPFLPNDSSFFLDINEQFCPWKLKKISQYYFFKNTFQAQPEVTFCINLGTFIHSFQLRYIIQTPHRFQLFFISGFSFTNITIHRKAGEGRVYLCDSSSPLPPASETLRQQLGDYCRELTPAHSQQSNPNWGPQVLECKSRTTQLRPLLLCYAPLTTNLPALMHAILKNQVF